MTSHDNIRQTKDAFKQFIHKHVPAIYVYLRRLGTSHQDAELLLRNIFANVWDNAPFFMQQEDADMWLYRYCFLECQAQMKHGFTPEESAFEEEIQRFRNAFLSLSVKERLVLLLVEERPVEKVAEILMMKEKECQDIYQEATKRLTEQNLSTILLENMNYEQPSTYFTEVIDKLLDELPDNQFRTATTWQKVKPWLYMLAMFVGIMLVLSIMKDCSRT